MTAKEDAFLIFGKWRDESIPLRVIGRLTSLNFEFDATIIGFDWARFALRVAGENNLFDLDFGECGFKFDIWPGSQQSALVCFRPDGEIYFIGSLE